MKLKIRSEVKAFTIVLLERSCVSVLIYTVYLFRVAILQPPSTDGLP